MAGDDLSRGRTVKIRLPDLRIESRKARTGNEEEETKPEDRALSMSVRVRHGAERSVMPDKEEKVPEKELPGARLISHDEAAEMLRQEEMRRSAEKLQRGSEHKGILARITRALRNRSDASHSVKRGRAGRSGLALSAFAAAALLIAVISGLVMSVSGSPMGILLSSEDSGYGNMREIIAEITEEYRRKIITIEQSVPHDRVEYASGGPYAVRWNEILSVYAVMISENEDTVSLNASKKETLRRLFDDMNRIRWTTRTEAEKEGSDEKEITVLTFSAVMTDAYEAADRMHFTDDQMSALSELLSGKYDVQFARIIGSWRQGGQILTPDGTVRALGMIGWPLSGTSTLTSGYGYRSDPFTGEQSFHGGIDLACPEGTPVLAAADGIVSYVNASDPWGYGYGYHVVIEHEKGLSTLYGHCSAVSVTSGQAVKAGEVIAYVGSTGNSTGNHLHFEVRRNGAREDPLLWFAY